MHYLTLTLSRFLQSLRILAKYLTKIVYIVQNSHKLLLTF